VVTTTGLCDTRKPPWKGGGIFMSSTHLSLHYHLIFGTKDHEPVIASAWRARLHAYMGGILSSLNVVPEIIGGVEDHVHILAGLRASACLADVMREVKSSSSRWVHAEIGATAFSWQEGYGAFTVSASQREMVRRYIDGQEEHHRTKTFKEEYLEFLQKSGVDFDPRYL
jgi:REP element-mobilizing transposase RayT